MKETAEHLRNIISEAAPLLCNINEEEASVQPQPGKWSKKEILGHLIDSACNNQQKFIRTMAQSHTDFVGYQQNFWVESQKYNQANWKNLIDLWAAYNQHLAYIIENVDSELLMNTITIDGTGKFTLEFIMSDYGEHLKHHLKQILPSANLESNFQNIYNT